MSEQQIIQQLNRIIKMLLQQTLPNKEVFNSFYKRRKWHKWLLSIVMVYSSAIIEAEKMTILNPERV